MVSAKSLIAQLHKQWNIVDALVSASAGNPFFSIDNVLFIIERERGEDALEDPGNTLRSLMSADILRLIPRADKYEINPTVLDFVLALTQEHSLGLSSVIKAKIEAVSVATGHLNSGVEKKEEALLWSGASALTSLFRQIQQQLQEDRQAILNLAEAAKSASADIPIARRYREVLEAYDYYVEPMNELMDSGPHGAFYPRLVQAERALDGASASLMTQGVLHSHQVQIRHMAFQAKELRRQGSEIAQQCADILMPLREEVRQHNRLTAAISMLLGVARKRGLDALYADNDPPLWRRDRRHRISHGLGVRQIMADAQGFVPDHAPLVILSNEIDNPLDNMIKASEVQALLAQALPVPNLMTWLSAQFPLASDADLLKHYCAQIDATQVSSPTLGAQLSDAPLRTDLRTISILYHPQGIYALPSGASS